MVGWHYRLTGHEFEQTPGDSERQGTLAYNNNKYVLWRLLKNLTVELTYNLAIQSWTQVQRMLKLEKIHHPSVLRCTIYNKQDMEAT